MQSAATLAQPLGASDAVAEGFPALLKGEGVGVHAPGEPDAVALDADGLEARRGLGGGEFPGVAGFEGKSDGIDVGGADGLEELVGETACGLGAGGGPHEGQSGFGTVVDEGEGIEQTSG